MGGYLVEKLEELHAKHPIVQKYAASV